jgi:hypothetical protein
VGEWEEKREIKILRLKMRKEELKGREKHGSSF